jgi:hypothetical protein
MFTMQAGQSGSKMPQPTVEKNPGKPYQIRPHTTTLSKARFDQNITLDKLHVTHTATKRQLLCEHVMCVAKKSAQIRWTYTSVNALSGGIRQVDVNAG